MQWSNLLKSLQIYQCVGAQDPNILSIVVDSRQVTAGSLFVCIQGYTVDGHNYIQQAEDAGARAILAQKPIDAEAPVAVVPDSKRAAAILADTFYDHPTRKLNLVGVTGTNGKTTTTYLIEKIFADQGRKTGLIGTLGMSVAGEPLAQASTTPTTPEAADLQQAFATMVDQGAESAVMEVSSHALDMGRARGCDFNIGVFTNLTQEHLEYHKTMKDYLWAKSLLFSQLGNTYDREHMKAAVINADDPHADVLKKVTSVQLLTYGVQNDCDIRATNIDLSEKGTRFTLSTPFGECDIHSGFIGMFNVYNALAAASAALLSGISLLDLKVSLEGAQGVPGRFERVEAGQSYTVIVDYAHTPDSLENVLRTVQQFAKNNIFVVVGCGGDRDKTKRPLMAEIAVKYGDTAVFTSDNPRTEDPMQIIRDMENGAGGAHYVPISDRARAIDYAIAQAEHEDIVVIAGKGHETYQVLGEKVIDFDDRDMARYAIQQRVRSQ